MNVETLLTQRIGDAGKRLHTARSRNDQVAVDTAAVCEAGDRPVIIGQILHFQQVLLQPGQAVPGRRHARLHPPAAGPAHLLCASI